MQPCCWARSGIGTYTYEIAKQLKNDEIFEFQGNVFNFMERHDNTAALDGISMPINVCKSIPYGLYRRIWNMIPICYSSVISNQADLSIFFNFIVPPRVEGKVATVIHDVTYLRNPETIKKSNLKHLLRGIEYSIERSDKVIATSQFTKTELQRLLLVPKEKISVVHSAPSISTELEPFAGVCERFGIKTNYILFVGTIEPRKNIVRLLTAFEKMKSYYGIHHQLVLAGGKGWRDEDIRRKLSESKYKEDIILTGYVKAAEKNTLYKYADAFVFPSIYEGFGMPPLEAMHWNCPVVCSNVSSIPEIVGDAAEFVDPLDDNSIAEGMMRVITDHNLANRLRINGEEQTKKFTWERSAEELKQVCREILYQ